MTADQIVMLVLVAATIVVFVINRLPVEVVAVLVALALWATGVLDVNQAFAGFGDPTVIVIAALFVVAEGLDSSGVTAWAGQQLARAARGDKRRLLVLVMLASALLAALISVNAAVAALLPMAVLLAVRMKDSPSRYLMPLAFAAHAGSQLVLTGSPVNVLTSAAVRDETGSEVPFFAFGLLGVPLLAGTVLLTLWLGPRLIPQRTADTGLRDLSRHPLLLSKQYLDDPDRSLVSREIGIAEVIVAPRSPLIGTQAYAGMVTESGELVVLAHQRAGRRLPDHAELRAGDALLLEGTWEALDRQLEDPSVLIVDHPDDVRRQTTPFGPAAWRAVAVLAAMVVLLAIGILPTVITCVLAALAMLALRVVTPGRALRSLNLQVLILIAGLIPLSVAMAETGTADLIAAFVIDGLGGGPLLLIAALFVVTALLGQLVSNTATALIMIPIGVSIAHQLDLSVISVLLSLNVGFAAALLTPIATPGNLMVMRPAGYRFGDYWRFGGVLMLVYLAVAVFLVPLIWPL